MARKKKKRSKQRRRKHAPKGYIGPTKETRRKVRPDNLLYLYERGSITKGQRDAALEIREMIEALQSRFLKAANYELAPGRGRPGSHHPLAGLAPILFYRFHNKYAPWRTVMERSRRVDGIAPLPCVYSIIIEGNGTRELDTHYAVKRGTVLDLLRSALDRYISTPKRYPA